MFCPLSRAGDPLRFGGKAASLARAAAGGLPVAPGVAIEHRDLDLLAGDPGRAATVAADLLQEVGAPVAVRASLVAEDAVPTPGAERVSRLGVSDVAGVAEGLRAVQGSAWRHGGSYRRRPGAAPVPVAAVVQRAIAADCGGVLFARNPATGADERVIEAAWGLSDAVVQGLVTPDCFRLARDGSVLEVRTGAKDVQIALDDRGGTREVEVSRDRASAPCLDAATLAALAALATAAERCFARPHDLEWVVVGGAVWLLRCRPVAPR